MPSVSWVYDTSAHSQNQVFYFTSVEILSIESALTNKKEAVISAKGKYVLDLQVNKYSLLPALWQEEPVEKQ